MTIKEALKKPYYVIKHNHALWFNIFNRTGRRLFLRHPLELSAVEKRIVSDLDSRGIAFTSLDELTPGENLLEKLDAYMATLDASADFGHKKSFLKPLWDPRAILDFDNPFFRFALSEKALAIASSYLRMWPRFKYQTLNITLPVSKGNKAEFSQRWHRDPEELKQLKVFIYLSDVTPDRGPFIYVAGSNHGTNAYSTLFPQQPPAGVYPPDGAVEKAVNAKDMIVATGKPGTVIFCDTSGLHKGGYATGGDRVMYTTLFTAPSYAEKPWYRRGNAWKSRIASLTPIQRFALHD